MGDTSPWSNMVAGGGDRGQSISSAKTSAFPTNYDIKSDTMKPGKADVMRTSYSSALRSRDWWWCIVERPPVFAEVRLANPELSDDDISEAIAQYNDKRQRDLASVAQATLDCFKLSSIELRRAAIFFS